MPTKKTLALALSTFLDPATKEPVAITVLQNVLVGAVDAQHVSLRVIPEEAELLAVAQHLGSITLTLRNSDDVDVLEERGRATINTLVSGERARILQQKRFTTIQIIRGTGAPTEDMPPVTGTGTQAVPDLFLKHYGVNPTLETRHERFSTFAADVDTASYALARAWLSRGALPDESAVRVEEFVNAFDYAYRPPQTEAFAVQVEAFPSPSRPGYHLLHVGVQGQQVTTEQRRPANLVFAIDASGSMEGDQRLGLVKQALNLLVAQLKPDDTVAIVVYGTRARLVLGPTAATDRDQILGAIAGLQTEGSTNVQAGLELAYDTAAKAFGEDGINRVILCSRRAARRAWSRNRFRCPS